MRWPGKRTEVVDDVTARTALEVVAPRAVVVLVTALPNLSENTQAVCVDVVAACATGVATRWVARVVAVVAVLAFSLAQVVGSR